MMEKIPQSPFVLIDGSSYLYRAYHAFPSLKNSLGESTGTMYGVLKMLRSLILKYQPRYAAIIFDAMGKTFRNKLYKHYKSHRLPMPDEMRIQIDPLHKMIKAMGISLMAISGVEADDVIGTLARSAEKIGHLVLISTDDKDMAQLVTSRINLINIMTNTMLGPKEVVAKYGVPPELIIDFLALMGDSSDNIPGIPGIGKKTALALLQEIGGLNQLYSQINKIAELKFRGAKTIAKKMEQNKEIAYLSFQLATIKTDIKLDITYEQLAIQDPDVNELLKLFKKYEFTHWSSDLKVGKLLKSKKIITSQEILVAQEKTEKKTEEKEKKEKLIVSLENYEILLEESQLISWIKKLEQSSAFSIDIKTDGIDNISANLLGLSFSTEPGVAAYLPMVNNYLYESIQISRERSLELLKPILENKIPMKIGQNLKFDHSILQNYGIELNGIAFDTMLESYTLDSVAGKHDMDSLSIRWLENKSITLKEKNSGKKKNQMILKNRISFEELDSFPVKDADVILQLHLKMWPNLQQQKGLLNIFKHIEMPLVPVLSRIERNGVKIDPVVMRRHSKEISFRLLEIEKTAYDIAGESFNLSSTKQLQSILFDKQGIKPLKKTPGGAPSTSEEVLEELSINYPLPKVILQYRSLAKLKSTYIDKLPLMINPKTGRVHTSYHQSVTATGRLSSSDPNLQNIPVRGKEGRRIRQAFIASEDYLIVSADYSQIELRIMAHLSRDKGLLTAFSKNKDIHCSTAAELFSLSIDKVTDEQRRSAKAINFGLIYGMSAFGLSRQLNITQKKSKKYMEIYFERYPAVKEYMEMTRSETKKKGYVETIDGRRLYLPDIKSTDAVRRASAERAAVNAPLQGTAADIIKRAMIAVDMWLEKERPRVRMIMQVHDELVFEIHKDEVLDASQIIRNMMENSMLLDIPIPVKIRIGPNWDQAH